MNNTIKIEDGRLFIDYVEVKNVNELCIDNDENGYNISVKFQVLGD